MSPTSQRRFKIAAPWIAGFVVLIAGFWIWDARVYPVPRFLDPSHADPFSPKGRMVQLVDALRMAKRERFWRSFDLAGTEWQATHFANGKTWKIRFTGTRVFVEPSEITADAPFVNDTPYQFPPGHTFLHAVIPVVKDDGTVSTQESPVDFDGELPDGMKFLYGSNDYTGFHLRKLR